MKIGTGVAIAGVALAIALGLAFSPGATLSLLGAAFVIFCFLN
jgi:hypothetical protein